MSNPDKKDRVKGQHYISQGILKHFSKNKYSLFELLLFPVIKAPFATNINDTMNMNFTYEHKMLPENTIEKHFQKIETYVIPRLDEIIEKIALNKIDWKELEETLYEIFPDLLVFYYRSGALLTEYTNIQSEDKIPLLSEKILNIPYLRLLTKTVREDYKFCILKSNKNFLLSDQYISTAALKIKSQYSNISNRNIGLEDTLILIPLSAEYYIALWNDSSFNNFKANEVNNLSDEELSQINNIILNNSYTKCICYSSKPLIEAKDSFEMNFPSTVYIGYKDGSTGGAIKKKEVFFFDIDKKAFQLLETVEAANYIGTGRNDTCPCKSGKKFKKCHLAVIERLDKAFISFRTEVQNSNKVIELPISEWRRVGTLKK